MKYFANPIFLPQDWLRRKETMESNKEIITGAIGLFSGRPNPELSLMGEAVEELANLVKSCIGKEKIHPPPAAKLGYYYGFRLHVPKDLAKRLNLPEDFNVYQGVITERRNQEQNYWRDMANVERFLIDQAFEQGYGDMLQKVGITKFE